MGKSRGKKRKANRKANRDSKRKKPEAIEDVDDGRMKNADLPDGWIQKFLTLGPELVYLLAILSTQGKIPISQIRKAKFDMLSFSSVLWRDLAPEFDLPFDPTMGAIDSFSIETFLLPPSFHETTAKAAWRTLDVFQDIYAQCREELRIRTFDAYLIPIVGLFDGRIVDMPERLMMSSSYFSRGEIEHTLITGDGILFVVIEKKFYKGGSDTTSQLFLDLLSAAEMNSKSKFKDLRVYGLLTDLSSFCFYSYDPVRERFASDGELTAHPSRHRFIGDMMHVTNKVFSIILFAYVEALAVSASVEESREGPSASCQTSGSVTLDFAKQCLSKFKEPVDSMEDVEKKSCQAIELLRKSVQSIPRITCYSEKDPSSEDELSALSQRIVHAIYMPLVGTPTMSTPHGGECL